MTTPNASQSFVIKTDSAVFDWPGGPAPRHTGDQQSSVILIA